MDCMGVLLGNRAGLVSFISLGLGSSLRIVIAHSDFLCDSLILTLGKGTGTSGHEGRPYGCRPL
jgi:hypothetical protein